MERIDTVAFSDLHMASGVARSKELLAVLRTIVFNRLILIGDIIDHIDRDDLSEDDMRLIFYLRKLSLSGIKVIWIKGNHDAMLTPKTLKGLGLEKVGLCKKTYIWFCGGKKFGAIHGHQFDRFLFNHPLLSDLASFIYLLIQKIDTKNKIISRFAKRYSKSWLREAEEVKKGVIWFAKSRLWGYALCGHTHLMERAVENDVHYYNIGCWTDTPSGLALISKKGEVEIKKIY